MIYDKYRAWLIPIKLIVAISFLVYGKKVRKKSDYVVNRLFFYGFLSFALYLILDSAFLILTPASQLWYNIANIVWVLSLLGLFLYTFFTYMAGRIINQGEHILRRKVEVLFLLGLFIIAGTLMGVYSEISVINSSGDVINSSNLPPTGNFRVIEKFSLLSTILALIPFGFNFWTLIFLNGVRKKAKDEHTKKRMELLLWGLFMIPLGLLYFLLRSNFFPIYQFWDSIIGQIFFFIAPLLISKSQALKKEH